MRGGTMKMAPQTMPMTRKAVSSSPGKLGKMTSPSKMATSTATFTAKVGQPFKVAFEAQGQGINWCAAGKVGESYRNFGGKSFNPPRHIPWMEMDPATGVLSGTPRVPGVYPVVICAWAMSGSDLQRKPGTIKADARMIVVTVTE